MVILGIAKGVGSWACPMNAISRDFPSSVFCDQMGSRSRCVVLVRTYASPSWKRRPDISSTKSRTAEVASSGSRPSGKLPKSKSERKELPSLRPISRLSKHQAHAMVLYKDGETYLLCVHTVPRCTAVPPIRMCAVALDTPRVHTTSAFLCAEYIVAVNKPFGYAVHGMCARRHSFCIACTC